MKKIENEDWKKEDVQENEMDNEVEEFEELTEEQEEGVKRRSISYQECWVQI